MLSWHKGLYFLRGRGEEVITNSCFIHRTLQTPTAQTVMLSSTYELILTNS